MIAAGGWWPAGTGEGGRVRRIAYLFAGVFLAVLGLMFALILLAGPAASQACGGPEPVSGAGEPPLVQYYIAAAHRYALGANGYAYLAAINRVETTFGTNLSTSTADAIGWMQFLRATFATYGVAVTTPGGKPDPYDPQDAIYSAANYLHASGAPGDWSGAIFTYNHAGWYVSEVETLAARYTGPAGLANLTADINSAWGAKPPANLPTPTPATFVSQPAGSCCPAPGTACPLAGGAGTVPGDGR